MKWRFWNNNWKDTTGVVSPRNKINATINILQGTNRLNTAVFYNQKVLAAFMDGWALFSVQIKSAGSWSGFISIEIININKNKETWQQAVLKVMNRLNDE